jgi:hypothetical protein
LFSGAFSASFGPVSWIYQVNERLQVVHPLPVACSPLCLDTPPHHNPLSLNIQSEIFPMNQRAYGTAVSTASNWVSMPRYIIESIIG